LQPRIVPRGTKIAQWAVFSHVTRPAELLVASYRLPVAGFQLVFWPLLPAERGFSMRHSVVTRNWQLATDNWQLVTGSRQPKTDTYVGVSREF
jgi:hypothetical protein